MGLVWKKCPVSIGQVYGGDFAKFCGLFRIYELNKCLIFRHECQRECGKNVAKHIYIEKFHVKFEG